MPRKNDPAYKTENSVFAARLRKIMEERGVNQTTLANKITSQYVTIQRQTISLYMSGQSRPDTERLTAIAQVLDVSADWLLGLSEEPAINGNVAQASRYTGLSALSISKLHESLESSYGHSKALLWLIEQILQDHTDDFITWSWRAAMARCCPKISIEEPEFAEIRHNADMRIVEAANAEMEGISKTVEVPIVDYEDICTATAIGIIQKTTETALEKFKIKFVSAFELEKAERKNRPRC